MIPYFFKNSDVGVLTSEDNSITFTGFTGGLIDESSKRENLVFVDSGDEAPDVLPLLSTVISEGELKDVSNQITKDTVVFDLTQTYVSYSNGGPLKQAGDTIPEGTEPITLSTEEIKLGLTTQYNTAQYQNSLNLKDFAKHTQLIYLKEAHTLVVNYIQLQI